ncbi:ankyrin repeat domain-containing protein [Geovibrio thiophilus]|nr:ankyrin repeat domain-containing protein [Geovibrio thiophilus]
MDMKIISILVIVCGALGFASGNYTAKLMRHEEPPQTILTAVVEEKQVLPAPAAEKPLERAVCLPSFMEKSAKKFGFENLSGSNWQEFAYAVRKKHVNELEKELGITYLHLLAATGRLQDAAEYLERYPAEVNSVDRWGNSPLHYAVMNGELEAVKLLYDMGADIKRENSFLNGDVLWFALLSEEEQSHEITDLLLEKGCSFADSNKYILGVLSDREKQAKYLTEILKNTDPFVPADPSGSFPVINAILRDDTTGDAVNYCLEKGIDLDIRNHMFLPLQAAMSNSAVTMNQVERMIELGADVNGKMLSTGQTPLMYAVKGRRFDMAELLLRKGAGLDVLDNRNQDVYEYLVDKGMYHYPPDDRERMRTLLDKYRNRK